MRDMCEDLKGLYFVIKGNGLREKWIYNFEMYISFSKTSCIKESAFSSWEEMRISIMRMRIIIM
jgi:hypothetical protein